MKRIFFIVAFAAAACTAAAQNYMVVNSEKVYKSIDAYNKAIAELDELDVISSNIIQDHVQELEKFQWFMRSHLA